MDSHFDGGFVHTWGGGRGPLLKAGVPSDLAGRGGSLYAEGYHDGASVVE